ncbi:MAG: hypothetical protein CMJ76_13185 [Planctomycetaceae bacterium]|nr:hypothetical protein [Planctomycetaceae bacterium]
MKKIVLTALFVFMPTFVQAGTTLSDIAIQEVKDEISRATKAGEIEGGMILVHVDGRQVLLDVQGYHDLEDKLKFKADSLLRIYSMTKPITSVVAMTLWEQGKFKLDDPVASYIPSFKHVKVGVVVKDKMTRTAPKRPLTVRDLLAHTSGYSYSPAAGTPFGREYRSRGVFYTHSGMYPPKMSIREAADQLAQIPLQHQPGERWTYGLNVDILGALIEIWSGESLEKYMKRSVFKPLKMKDTFFDIPKNKLDRFVSCHTWEGDRQVIIDKWSESSYRDGFEFHSGGGGLVSTIGDYSQFSQMLAGWGQLDGIRVLRKETLKEMFKNQVVPGGGRSFGLGFAVETAELAGAKKPLGQYGWGGYANTEFRVIPDAGVSMVFMRQTVPSTHRMSEKLFGILRSGITIK